MRSTKLSFTTRYVLLVGILLFVATSVLGFVSLDQSKTAMRSLINKNMLDVVRSAAGSLDGDELGALTADDVDGPVFNEVKERLLVFQDSVDIEFIYAVKKVGEGKYVFTVDPDPVDPGEFGEEVLTTSALIHASEGIPTVDESPAADRWGNFYSAYCPVFDSGGQVAGIVGVDFDAAWYDAQVQKYTVSIAAITTASVLLGGFVVGSITRRVRKRFKELDAELSSLSADVDLLMDEVSSYSGVEVSEEAQDEDAAPSDELEVLGGKIRSMHAEMRMYLAYLRTQAYTDALTRVGNSTAYHEQIELLNTQIADGVADFWTVVFDLNSLKQLNDTYGHECGDYYIQGAASSLVRGFADAHVYRIGGDEFAVIAEGVDEGHVEECLRGVREAIATFNATTEYPAELSLAQGLSRFDPEQDTLYTDVFARADRAMYDNKRAYYEAAKGSE